MQALTPRAALIGMTIVAALILGSALASEYWGGLVPCALCLVERWPYRIAVVLGILGIVLPPRFTTPVLILFGLTMVGGMVAGFVHVGVEMLWWPSPMPECIAPNLAGKSIADRLAAMPARPSKPCDEPTFLIPFLPISLAGMNMLAATILAIAAGATAKFLGRG